MSLSGNSYGGNSETQNPQAQTLNPRSPKRGFMSFRVLVYPKHQNSPKAFYIYIYIYININNRVFGPKSRKSMSPLRVRDPRLYTQSRWVWILKTRISGLKSWDFAMALPLATSLPSTSSVF